VQASPPQYPAAKLFYVLSLSAASVALFGVSGLAIAAFVLLVWWQILVGAQRESGVTTEPTFEPRVYRSEAMSRSSLLQETSQPLGHTKREGRLKNELLVVLLIVVMLVGLLVPAQSDIDLMSHAESSMMLVAKAVQVYEHVHGSPLPTIVRGESGTPMHSWRALLLPHLGEEKLAHAYRMEEAWNSPHNTALTRHTPWIYQILYSADSNAHSFTSLHLLHDTHGEPWIVEHEESPGHWMSPNELTWSQLRSTPDLHSGFWKRGFFCSTHRGRVAIYGDRIVHVHATDGHHPQGAAGPEYLVPTPAEEEHPLRVIHWHNILRLSFFLVVALYPLRWLERVHRQ
jgi:hypothetical protein